MIGAGPYDDFIQTDASINQAIRRPLFNMAVKSLASTPLFSARQRQYRYWFAVPVNLVKNLVPELETKGTVTRGWLGVSVQPVTPDLARSFGLEKNAARSSATWWPRGPLKAGIKRGDVIVSYDGKKIDES
jgi:serine protease Do